MSFLQISFLLKLSRIITYPFDLAPSLKNMSVT